MRPMMRRPAQLGIRLRIDFGPASSLGPGKIALLEHIGGSGSLSQAARELGMSYRRAWLLLDDLNHSFSEPVTTASIGGAGGGGARLTDFGRKLVAAYRDVERATDEVASARLGWLAGDCVSATPHATRRPLNRSLERRSPTRRRG
jgi:molybdate transport system regulatory protein